MTLHEAIKVIDVTAAIIAIIGASASFFYALRFRKEIKDAEIRRVMQKLGRKTPKAAESENQYAPVGAPHA